MSDRRRLVVGTANWNELRCFYPRGTKQDEKLAYYATQLTAVEVNATFFRMLPPSTIARWADQTSDDFTMSLKAHRLISGWLRNPDKAVQDGFDKHVAMVQPAVDAGKFLAFLIQFPGKLEASTELERGLGVVREGFGDLPLVVQLPPTSDAGLRTRIGSALKDTNIAQVRHDPASVDDQAEAIESGDVTYFRFRGAELTPEGDTDRAVYSDAEIAMRADLAEAAASSDGTIVVVFYGKKDVDTADAALRLTDKLRRREVTVG